MKKDILSLINQRMNTFSKGQKMIANYILNSYDKAAFMTANRLGKTVAVSESTVVRFAAELGFSGYPSMQKALQEMIRNKLTSIQRMEVSNEIIGSQDILSMVMHSDMEKIRITMEQADRQSFHDSVQAIIHAKRIYVLGIRSSSSLSGFLSFYFRLIFDNVIHVDEGTTIFEQIGRIGENDVIIGISFPRYSQRTVKALSFARNQGAKVIAITDSAESSVAKTAHHLLLAQSDMASFVDSLVAPLSMINALLVSVARQRAEEVSKTLENLEKIWTEDEVFVSPEDEL
jgi:DNA-binding MurR/RpiR family transcriptional regulator